MKKLEGALIFYEDEEGTIEVDHPYYSLPNGRRVAIEHVYVADWRDTEGQHEAVETAARDGRGEVISIDAGDDNYHFCNEKRVKKPRKKAR